MTFWHVEQRDAREPLDCWRDIKLLVTDTPGPGAVNDEIILEALRAWKGHLAEDGIMLVHSHIARPDFQRVKWYDHRNYYQAGVDELIETYTAPGDIVADPFCGSSITGVFALKMGRSFIGTDIGRPQIEGSFETLTKGESPTNEESRWMTHDKET